MGTVQYQLDRLEKGGFITSSKRGFSLDNSIKQSLSAVDLSGTVLYVLVIFASFGEIINLIFVSIILTIIKRTRKIGMILMITIVLITIVITYFKPIIAHLKPDQSVKLSLFQGDLIWKVTA